MHTPDQVKAAADALMIIKGASNAKGISQALVDAYRAWDDTNASNHCAPAVLILEQLAHLAGLSVVPEYKLFEAEAECTHIVRRANRKVS